MHQKDVDAQPDGADNTETANRFAKFFSDKIKTIRQ